MGTDNHRIDCKVVLLGKEYGGKTSLLERFLHGQFQNAAYQNTIGAAFGAQSLTAKGQSIILGIWDTAGAERYEAMSRIYYRDAKAAIVCYDVTEQYSFDRARFWVNELLQNEENCKLYLTGTKVDLVQEKVKDRIVDVHDVTDYAEEIGAFVMETSSKTGENVAELFQQIAEDFVIDPNNAATLQDAKDDLFVDLYKHSSRKEQQCCKR